MRTQTLSDRPVWTCRVPGACCAPRNGVVLIVVLGMLAVLALIGVAFITFSSEEEQSSNRFAVAFQIPRVDMPPDVLLLEALNQLIADTNNPQSAIRGHSLLADMYGPGCDYSVGPDGRPGVAGVDDDGANGIDDFGELGFPGSDDRDNKLEVNEWYTGAFTGPGDRGLFQPLHAGPDGIPGTFDDCFDVNFIWNGRLTNPKLGPLAGGFNEDYDYPDRQNMFLGLLRADGTVVIPSYIRPGVGAPVDSDLAAPLIAGRTAPLTVTQPDQRARLKLLRPRGGFTDSNSNGRWDPGEPRTENPNFPAFNPLVLDVDNNGDGFPDSVWIDLGFPVQQTANGRKFKPLFAFLIVDADGKLNINAHGNLANVLQAPPGHADFDTAGNVLGQGYSVAEVALENIFKDISLLPANSPLAGAAGEYNQLLSGRPAGAGGQPIPGRYGEANLLPAISPRAGQTNANYSTSPPSLPAPPAPGVLPISGDDDNPGTVGTPPYWAYPQRGNALEGMRAVYLDYALDPFKNGRYGTPPDFNGDGSLGVDNFGRYIYYAPSPFMGFGGLVGRWNAAIGNGHLSNYDNVDDQTEMDLYTSRLVDAGFSPSDLEFLYRRFDTDASALYSRLQLLAPSLFPPPGSSLAVELAAARRRNMLTTESWDLIRFNMFPLTQPQLGSPFEPVETELSTYRQRGSGKFNTNGLAGARTPATAATSPGLVPEPTALAVGSNLFGLPPGLPEEIARGRRLNINRGFFGTVTTTGIPYYRTPVPHPNTPGITDPRTVARDIYLLLRQLHPVDPTTATGRIACEQMAQYAVNLVDFRDSDQIMTGFEFVYDLRPNGWFVDGDLSAASPDNLDPNRGLVWGVEAPQVVINETYAIEDPSAPNLPQLWFEISNPQFVDPIDNAFRVNLRGPGADSAYQVVLADTTPGVVGSPAPGEPSTTGRRLEFTNTPNAPAVGGTGATLVNPGDYYLVGPATVAGNPFNPPPDFVVPEGTFSPTAGEIGTDLRLYLRRLADPTNAHDAGADGIDGTQDDVNPYLTVDALDVHVYSANEVNPPAPLVPTHRSLERVQPYSVKRDFHTAGSAAPHTLKALNEKAGVSNGAPYAPLPFNDRPFANAMEMLLVPAVRPQWLTSTFVIPNGAFSPYAPTANRALPIRTGDSGDVNPATPFIDAPYFLVGHMFNFFREDPQPYPAPGLHRIFEFVEVPSRMNGSSEPTIGPLAGDARLDRVPGRMNINTAIAEEEQFLAMFNNHPLMLGGVSAGWPVPPGPLARALPVAGAAPTTPFELAFPCQTGTIQIRSEILKRCLDSMLGPDGIMGTADDLPFRTMSMGTSTIAAPQMIQPTDIHNTLFRAWPGPAAPLPPPGSPRFTPAGALPLLTDTRPVTPPGGSGAATLVGYSKFENQPLEKISNIVTTRSNVYAVWVTVGFFEVLNEDPNRLNGPAPNDFGVTNAPPELGEEINAATGQNVRHRAFFIIDRSKAHGYNGPTRNSAELQDILSQVMVYSRIVE